MRRDDQILTQTRVKVEKPGMGSWRGLHAGNVPCYRTKDLHAKWRWGRKRGLRRARRRFDRELVMEETSQQEEQKQPFVIPTQDQILSRFNERKPRDHFGFEVEEYMVFLDFDHVKPLLKPEVTREAWDKNYKLPTRELMLKTMHEYMTFAWEKANDCRGISANRSIMHFIAWIWLAGEPEFSKKIDETFHSNYQHYGKEILILIAEHYSWDWKQWDDGVRTNDG